MLALIVAGTLTLAQPDLMTTDDAAWHRSKPLGFSRVEIETPGGPLPFVVGHHTVGTPFTVGLTIWNGSESILGGLIPSLFGDGRNIFQETGVHTPPVVDIEITDHRVRLVGESMFSDIAFCCVHQIIQAGVITMKRSGGPVDLPFTTQSAHSRHDRFDPVIEAGAAASFKGRWSVDFSSTREPAVGVFDVDEKLIATGTFLTPTGDYRHLAGRVDGDLMRLSTFDGAHAYLFHARMQPDGTISGDFWSGNWHHETWTAERDDDARLPDLFAQTAATAAPIEDLVFRSLDGTPTRVADLLDAGGSKARIIEVFGSWCPNCADAGAEMRRLKDRYGDQLTIVGLAFERSAEHAEAAERVRAYADRFRADWPLLIGGLADKAKASAELPILDQVRAFPTTIFLNERNEVVRVHSGFVGPAGRGDHLEQQRAFEAIIDGLLAE